MSGQTLINRPKDYACMRRCHQWLGDECSVMNNEYALTYNKYVIDFCETTRPEEQTLLQGVIH